MIPKWNLSGVLPPFVGASPVVGGLVGASPYIATILEFAQQFCVSDRRIRLFQDLLDYRRALLAVGLSGRQWLDGSFCEDVERIRRRPPGDIDVVNLLTVAPGTNPAALLAANPDLFDWAKVKSTYHCDAYHVDMGRPGKDTYRQIAYYLGLFSHQKATSLWKGMLEVPLPSDDDQAKAFIATIPP